MFSLDKYQEPFKVDIAHESRFSCKSGLSMTSKAIFVVFEVNKKW